MGWGGAYSSQFGAEHSRLIYNQNGGPLGNGLALIYLRTLEIAWEEPLVALTGLQSRLFSGTARRTTHFS